MPVKDLERIAKRPEVAQITAGDRLAPPTPDVSRAGAKRPRPRSTVGSPRRHRKGKDVLIGIIDVGGFDFSHPDFLDARGETRFVRIWDQGGSARPTPAARNTGRFDYGAEFLKEALDKAIKNSRREGIPPRG